MGGSMNREYPEERYPHKKITEQIIKAAFVVHNRLGHSFQEKIYENALVQELELCNLLVE
jgi:GxxExxY protein